MAYTYAGRFNPQAIIGTLTSRVQIGTTVQLNVAGSSSLASVYTDKNRTAGANPFNTSAQGNATFFADVGDYDLILTIDSIVQAPLRISVRPDPSEPFAADASVVHLTGNESVGGNKTFTGSTAFSGAATLTASTSNRTPLTIDGADWGTALFIKSNASGNNTKTLMATYGTSQRNVPQFRRARGTLASPAAVQSGDGVFLIDAAALGPGAQVSTIDADNIAYGGGILEIAGTVDAAPVGSGTGQVPGRLTIGTCLQYAMVDPGPIDLLWFDSTGQFSIGKRAAPSKLLDVVGGDVNIGAIATGIAAPTVAAVGGGAGHTYQYKIVPCSAAGDGVPSAASGSVTNGTLGTAGRNWLGKTTTATLYNTIVINSAPAGASYFKILVSKDSGAYQYLFSTSNINGGTYVDDGTDTPVTYSASGTNPGGNLVVGQALTVGQGASISGASTIGGTLTLTNGIVSGSTTLILQSAAATNVQVKPAGTTRLQVNATGGSVICGVQGALATGATDGFLYIPCSDGAPTGVPTNQGGNVPIQYDRTNNKLWAYNGAWKGVVLA